MENLIVIQNEKIISNLNAIYKCCKKTEKDNCNNFLNKDEISPKIIFNSNRKKNLILNV